MNHALSRNHWIDHLRAFITLLVVAHHAAMAYAGFGYFNTSLYIASTHPVVDAARSQNFDIFIGFNDVFFMPLMFFISGLFFWGALQRRGRGGLFRERMRRLGLPFVLAELIVIPIAYFPAWLQAGGSMDAAAFLTDYLFHQQWPVGPPWFIWLLLAFNLLILLLPGRSIQILSTNLANKPRAVLALWLLLSLLSLVPLSLWLGRYTWTGFGPFDFQLNRVVFYFLFFLMGAVLGACNWQRILFNNNSLAGAWGLFWAVLSAGLFILLQAMTYRGWAGERGLSAALFFEILYVVLCLTTCIALLSLFRSYVAQTGHIWQSLSANAYGIYLFHYPFLIWSQYMLLSVSMSAAAKFLFVFAIALGGSWGLTALLRKSSAMARLI
ncbi:acyltransferase [Pedobacter sp. SYP-B3415]|uniref:acyltransferase family protein n=1 Tax=Pedobacter sp. SYP-B3415 TaxID=2496641 RepID=UPI00101CB01F|nr:acyltransferase [Pedobacter sp. SYP-B3415]